MRTRRQAKIEAEQSHTSSSRAVKKNAARGMQNDKERKQEGKGNKKVKKEKARSPSPQLDKQQNRRRGRKRKEPDRLSEIDSSRKSIQKSKQKEQKEKGKVLDQEKKEKAKIQSDQKNSREEKKERAKIIEKQDKIKQVIVKGAAPVDQFFDKGKDYHVLVHQNKVYSATLNQTNLKNNNNKFYNLQIIQSDKNENVNYFMTRWGRVGTNGQKSIQGPLTINVAISEYMSKYYEKHKNGDYRQLEMNYGDDEDDEKDDKVNEDGKQESQINPLAGYQQCKFPKPLKDLITLIFDMSMMNNQMKQIGYNVNKMPLGKLSKDNIKKGYNILKQLYDQIEHKKREDVMERLTNDFYSYIPHDVGFRNMRLFKLDTLKKVKEKLEMLESLAEIKIATQILKASKQQGNPIQNNYKKLNRQIRPIEKDSFTFKILNDYLQTTHASTHNTYDLELVDLFEVDSQMQRERYTKDIHNKMLLWHGSRLTNFVGILSQGLRIAPPEAPVTGYMFGKGVYFADMSSKSANYCFTSPENNTGILILCQVALGNCNEKMHADYYASNLPEGKHSTKGVGKTAPKVENFQQLDGVIIPMGPGESTKIAGCSLLYNQFIVYKIEQIKIRYLLRTKFNYKRF